VTKCIAATVVMSDDLMSDLSRIVISLLHLASGFIKNW